MLLDLLHLENYKETQRLEAKAAFMDLPKSIWETYSSFANTRGGIILLGVREKRDRSLYAIKVPNLRHKLQKFMQYVNDPSVVSCNLIGDTNAYIQEAGGKRIIVIRVPEAPPDKKPVYVGSDPMTGTYKRVGEADVHCSKDEIRKMIRTSREKREAVLFDLDGTLWDSSSQVSDSWNDCLNRLTDIPPRCTTEKMTTYMGKTLPDIAKMFLPELPEEEQLRVIRLCSDAEIIYLKKHHVPMFNDFSKTVKALSEHYFLGIVSNCQYGYIDDFLDSCGCPELFYDYEFAERTGLSKGENIRLLMERNHINKAVYVGDTQGDADAAKMAGIPFIHASYGYGTVGCPDATILSMSELTDIVPALLERNKNE